MPMPAASMCDVAPEVGSLGLTDPALIKPGDPDDSVVVRRMESLDSARMPALGSTVVDQDAVQLLRDWISALSDCNP